MWSRKELKEKAKRCVSMNYWKGVLAGLLLVVLCGGGGSAGSISGVAARLNDKDSQYDSGYYAEWDSPEEDWDDGYLYYEEDVDDMFLADDIFVFGMVAFVVLMLVLLIVLLVLLPLRIFIFNPLGIGTRRFFVKNLKEPAQFKEVCYAFDHNYKNCVKTEFLREIYTFLWTLLLVIPGIVKSYEYQMIPYILGEHPEMKTEEVFALSKSMMYGNKWHAFVLDLSFFGWYILNGITLGILGIFYLNPYVEQTNAALYQTLKSQHFQKSRQEITEGEDYGIYDSDCR